VRKKIVTLSEALHHLVQGEAKDLEILTPPFNKFPEGLSLRVEDRVVS
jgi:hypothetical protein